MDECIAMEIHDAPLIVIGLVATNVSNATTPVEEDQQRCRDSIETNPMFVAIAAR
jgi:hypothetical protein